MGDRHQFRANWHDYNDGLYFITVCVERNRHLLGRIEDGEMNYSYIGRVLDFWLQEVPSCYDDIAIVNYVIMPNHFHCIVDIKTEVKNEAGRLGCLVESHRISRKPCFHHNSMLSRFVGNLKRGVTLQAKLLGIDFAWQRSFHDYIIKHESAFVALMKYMDMNVIRWEEDRFYNR